MKVALVGFAPNTINQVESTDADEIWSIVWAYKYDELPRIDRLFEMHPIWMQAQSAKREYVKPREHWAWLQANKRIPVYMTEQRAEVPMSIAYPIDEVTAMQAHWTRSGKPAVMLSSSFDYMMALAIYEGFDEIEIIGAEMSSNTEYHYQREGYAFWHGFALGRGIRVAQHAPTQLLHKPKRYGFDGDQMVYRQDLERLRNDYAMQNRDQQAKVQYFEGQVQTASEAIALYRESEAVDNDTLRRLEDHHRAKIQRLNSERDQWAICNGALQAVEYLIREIDMDENTTQLYNPFETVVTEVE